MSCEMKCHLIAMLLVGMGLVCWVTGNEGKVDSRDTRDGAVGDNGRKLGIGDNSGDRDARTTISKNARDVSYNYGRDDVDDILIVKDGVTARANGRVVKRGGCAGIRWKPCKVSHHQSHHT